MDGDEAWRAGVERERQLGWAARHGARVVGLLSTAVSVTCIARDLWKGLSAGTLRYDPPARSPLDTEEIEHVEAALAEYCHGGVSDYERDIVAKLRGEYVEDEPATPADDPPPCRPAVVWEHDNSGGASAELHDHALLVQRHTTPIATMWTWEVSGSRGHSEETRGKTWKGGPEAKRRAEEALAVMLERVP